MQMNRLGKNEIVIAMLSLLIVCVLVGTVSGSPQVDVSSPIGMKWVKLGGAAVVGNPTSDVITTKNGYMQGEFNTIISVQYQKFVNGVIVHSDYYGPFYLSNEIFKKWDSLRGVTSEIPGVSLFNYTGVPTSDYTKDATMETGNFERGMIIFRYATGTSFAVTGEIWGHYVTTLGGVTGMLGFPKTEEKTVVGGGWNQDFEQGSIYYKPTTGAWAVQPGAIFNRWLVLDGPVGEMGFPRSDQKPVIGLDGTVIGFMQRFEKGTIYNNPNLPYGAFEVTGIILNAYETKYGGPAGWLGFPICGNATLWNTGDYFNDFENGVLAVKDASSAQPKILPIGDLSLLMQGFAGYGDDQDGIGGGQDMIVWITIDVDGVRVVDQFRWPESGYNGADHTWDPPLTGSLAQPVHRQTRIDVWVQSQDYDTPDPNDDCGTVHVVYELKNLWGLYGYEPTQHHADGPEGDSIDVWFGTQNAYPFDSSNFVDSLYWSFANFATEDLDYDQFAQTFTDVGPEETWLGHPLNKAFFEIAYKRAARNGNCYGMSIEAIDAMNDKSMYSEPIFEQYFPDTQDGRKLTASSSPDRQGLINQLNIKQAYQLGASELVWLLNQLALGNTHNPRQAFIESKAAFDRGDYPSISITNDYFWGGGHNVLPYKWENILDPTKDWRMYVADSNNPAGGRYTSSGHVPYTNPSYFELANIPNWYTYSPHDIYGDDTYEGGEFLGGRMFYYPYHVMDEQPATPFDGVSVGLSFLEMVIAGNTAQTNQVSDNAGHTFYEPGLVGPPTRWDQINDDAASGMPNLMRVPLIDGGEGSSQPEIYISKGGNGATYRYEMLPREGVAAGTPYTWLFNSGTLSTMLDIPGTLNVPDAITVSQSGTPNQAVSLSIPANGQAKKVAWFMSSGVKGRWFKFTTLLMKPNQAIELKLKNGGRVFEYQNSGPLTTADLEICADPGAIPVNVKFTFQPGAGSFDFAAPNTTLTYSGGEADGDWLLTPPPIIVTLVPTDYSGTGIKYTQYSLDGTTWTTYTGPFEYAREGVTTLYYRSKDNAGDQEPVKSKVFKINMLNIRGYKINRTSGLGLSGWTITLKNSTKTLTRVTNSSGFYKFGNISYGTYTLSETRKAGWTEFTWIQFVENIRQVQINASVPGLRNQNFTNAIVPNENWVGRGWICGPNGKQAASFSFQAVNKNGVISGFLSYTDLLTKMKLSGTVTKLDVNRATHTAVYGGTATIGTNKYPYMAKAISGNPGYFEISINAPGFVYMKNNNLCGGTISSS